MSFRGASAEALRVLAGDLDSALAGGADAAAVGSALFSVSDVLRSEPALRRTATDMSLAPAAKEGLVREIFGGKLPEAALELVAQAVTQRWTSTRDLSDVLEHLGVVSVVQSAGAESGRLSDELFAFGRIVSQNPGLRDALADPARSTADRGALLLGLLDGKALGSTVTLAQQALVGSHRTVGVALAAYQQVAADVHEQKVATVRVARPLGDAERERLMRALSRTYSREIHLNVIVDPDVIGGISVEIGNDVIDGTVLSRLDDARRKLAG